jgi:glycine/D-amino acid oxidase-like deaminating enzyme
MRLRYGSPHWLARRTSHTVRSRPPLTRELDVDVVIVGGGFTGCATALIFAEAGIQVAVLERARLGQGSAAASTALLMQEPDRYFTELVDRFGRTTARTIWRLSRRGVKDLTSTLARLRCGLRPTPSIHLALNGDQASQLGRDVAARHRAGFAGRLLDAAALRRRAGIEGKAGILTYGNAVVDPYRATLALAREAARAGAMLFEHSEATRVTPSSDHVTVSTDRGLVRARLVIVATGFATPAFKPLGSRFKMSTTYIIATNPVPARLRHEMADADLMVWDAERPYHYFRWTDDHRILFGGEDRPVPRGRRARRAALVAAASALRRRLEQLYPGLAGIGIERAWEGLFATTPDGLPYIGTHRRYPRHLFALGYGGNGMTFAFIAARSLLREYRGSPRDEDALFSFSR